MRNRFGRLALVFGLMTVLCVESVDAATVYDANAAFVASELGAGSSTFGAFSVGYSTDTSLAGQATDAGFVLFAAGDHTDNLFNANPTVQGFYASQNEVVMVNVGPGTSLSYVPFFGQSEILLHPGVNGENAIVRFTVPTAGSYHIVGSWDHLHAGNTTNAVIKNGVQLDSTTTYSPFNLTTTAAVGDVIDFSVNFAGDYYADSTGLYVTLTANPVPEPSSIALAGLGGLGLAIGAYRRRKMSAL